MRANYPEAYQYLKAKKDRHPREDAVEDYTQWTVRITLARSTHRHSSCVRPERQQNNVSDHNMPACACAPRVCSGDD